MVEMGIRLEVSKGALKAPALHPAISSAIDRITRKIVYPEAFQNTPKSPTVKKASKTLKRKKRTRTRHYPGMLEESIQAEARGIVGEIYVAENSPGGAYAHYIHEMKHKLWFNRGPGTIAKGDRADEKFIERAVVANQDKLQKILDNAIEKALKESGGGEGGGGDSTAGGVSGSGTGFLQGLLNKLKEAWRWH